MRRIVPVLFFGLSILFSSTPAGAQLVSDASQDGSGHISGGNTSDVLQTTKSKSQASEWAFTASAGFDSGRVFKDQSFLLTSRAVNVDDFTVEWRDWCGEIWTAQSIAGQADDRETDVYVCHRWHFGSATLEGNVAMFDVPHLGAIWQFQATISNPIGDKCTGTGNLHAMRGGFETEVAKIDVSCSFPIMKHLDFAPMVQLAHDTAYKVTSVGYDVGLETDLLIHPLTLRAHAEGYQTIDRLGPNGKRSDTIVGLALKTSW